MSRAGEMTGAEVDRWLAARAVQLNVCATGGVYVATLGEWGRQPVQCRASGTSYSEALGHVMALWERENPAVREVR